jgi:hypothetical protein
MSTQLILYPQYYQGFSSTATPTFNEYIVNGINFTGLDSTTLHNTTAIHPSQDAITGEHPYALGNWYRYTTTGGDWGAVTAPALAAGSIQLSVNVANPGRTGVYQQLSGLAVGGLYSVKILIATGQVGILSIEMYSGTVLQSQQPFSSNTTLITATFTAQTSNDIFLLDYTNTAGTGAAILIQNISIQESPTMPSLVYTELQDGQVICDLYQEEDIPLTLSVDDFKNVAEKVQSYSKDFNLPATKRNNQIFNDMFEITRSVGNSSIIFNPYVKTKCVLKQDGFILFEGYLRLIDVKEKNGEISYNVNLYSEVIALADILKDQNLANLDFSELDHLYNKDSIKDSWEDLGAGQGLPLINPIYSNSFAYDSVTGSNNTQVLKYPFIDWTHQYIIAAPGGAPTPGNPQLTTLEQVFRPCIKLKYLINKIFAAAGFNWTSEFFDSEDFGNLFMDFNWGSAPVPVVFTSTGIGWRSAGGGDQAIVSAAYTTLTAPSITFPSALGHSSGVFTATYDNQIYTVDYNTTFTWVAPFTATLNVEWIHTLASGVVQPPIDQVLAQAYQAGGFIYSGNFTIVLAAGDTLQCRAKASLNSQIVFAGNGTGSSPQFTVTSSLNQTTNDALLETLRGELGQWDFLKGIITMFNLVTLVDESNPNNILIEPYADVFIKNTNSGTTGNLTLAARSIEHDWTDKVDVSQMELKPLTDLNKTTVFKFVEDDEDYAFGVYRNATSGYLYGSKTWDASGFTILDGKKEIIADPFAATVSKPLDEQFANFIVPSLYSMTDDGTSEGFDNSPRIFYNNGKQSTGASYYIPPQNTLGSENQSFFLQFSHLTSIPTVATSPPLTTDTRDFVFESQQLFQPIGSPPVQNLYNTYWSPYFNELYSPDTRTMTLKVNLSPADVSSFKFYDTVFIKNRSFRVNRIDYKPNDLATVEFILIP